MRLLSGGTEFRPILATARRRAFHLECRDTYLEAGENEPLARFSADETTDPGGEWFADWAEVVRSMTRRGVAMERARIVTEPHTLYTRFLLALARHNVAAGEDVRYLPRHHVEPNETVAEDFWLLDDDTVAWSLFDARDYWVGIAATDDPEMVKYACAIRDRLWPKAIPYGDYTQR